MSTPFAVTLGAALMAILIGVALCDFWFASQRAPSIGERLTVWSRRNPVFTGLLLVVFGALIGHFYGQ
jgi:hypothetical protein